MGKQGGIGQRLYIDGYDISGDIGAITKIASPRAALDVTGLDMPAPERILGGVIDGEIGFNSFFNPETSPAAEHAVLSTLPTADRLVMLLTSITAGEPVACLSSKQVNYDLSRGADGAFSGAVQCLGSAGIPLEWGLLLTPKVTHALAASETGINDSAQTTKGAVGYLQHFSAATATVTYKIEHSSDSTNGIDGSWSTLLTFTTVPTPWTPIAERVAVNGTVKKYVRATTSGTGTDMVFAMSFRRRTAQDFDAA